MTATTCLEERWTDGALTKRRQRPELLGQRHCGDLGLHLRIEGAHRVEVEEVVEGGGGDIASERTDYERNHSPDSCPIRRLRGSSYPAEQCQRIGVERHHHQNPHEGGDSKRRCQVDPQRMLFWQKNQEHVESNDGAKRDPPPSPQSRPVVVGAGDDAFEQTHHGEHGRVEADQPDDPSRDMVAAGRLEGGGHKILAVGEGKQQQEHHRQHGAVASMPRQYGRVIGVRFGLQPHPPTKFAPRTAASISSALTLIALVALSSAFRKELRAGESAP